jgi:hypothetical protein
LLIAVLVYMGWAYTQAFFGYFHLDPLGLGLGIVEFMLVSLSLFSPKLVIAAVILIFVTAVRTWDPGRTMLARLVRGRDIRGILATTPFRRFVLANSADQLRIRRLS